MSGGGDSGGGAPANTTSTNTYVQDVPQWEQQYLSNLLGQSQTISQQPYQPFTGPQVAGFTPEQQQSFSNISDLVTNGDWAPTQAAGLGSTMAGANTASSIFGQGSPYQAASTTYNPLQAVSPFLGAAAGQATPGGIQSYMSPYINNVVQGIQDKANANWNNNIMPGVNDVFVGSGQFGSGRNAQVLGQAANSFQSNLNSDISNALQSGYQLAGSQAQAQAGILGNLANTAGTATEQQASNLQSAGMNLGNLANTQAGSQIAAGQALGNQGSQSLATGITANSALQAVGQQQQQQSQANLDVAKQNFQDQVNYPKDTASWLSSIIRGLPSGGTSNTQATTGPMLNNVAGAVSPLSSIGGALLGSGALGGSIGGVKAKRGGLISRLASGGMVDDDENQPSAYNIALAAEAGAPQINASDLYAAPSNDDAPPPPDPSRSSLGVVKGNQVVTASEIPNIGRHAIAPPDESQLHNLQLLAMAKGALTPAHSGGEALGNMFGGATDIAKYGQDLGQKYADRALTEEHYNDQNTLRKYEMEKARQDALNLNAYRQQTLAQQSQYHNDLIGMRRDALEQGKYAVNSVTGRLYNTKTGEPLAGGSSGQATQLPQKAAEAFAGSNLPMDYAPPDKEQMKINSDEYKKAISADDAARGAASIAQKIAPALNNYWSGQGATTRAGLDSLLPDSMMAEGAKNTQEINKVSGQLASELASSMKGVRLGVGMERFVKSTTIDPSNAPDVNKWILKNITEMPNVTSQIKNMEAYKRQLPAEHREALSDAFFAENPIMAPVKDASGNDTGVSEVNPKYKDPTFFRKWLNGQVPGTQSMTSGNAESAPAPAAAPDAAGSRGGWAIKRVK